jgi:tetratricopeptide (TPR) repeat protein
MAQTATNPKIEELRGRLKADPKSRLFYPLAEELRKINQCDEAEHVLRAGLSSHPTYLSAWVSLGRTLRELKKNPDAVEALNKALLLDPGNVVAARLLADAYLDMGEKVEAIKKYKLVYALLPSDDTLEGIIEKLDREINAPAIIPEPEAPFELTGAGQASRTIEQPAREPVDERVFDETGSSIIRQQRTMELATGDNDPMGAAHSDSPFEDPGVAEGYGSDAFSIEQPAGMHLADAPMAAELPAPLPFESLPNLDAPPPEIEPVAAADEAEVFEPADTGMAPGIVTEGYAVTSSMSPLDESDFGRIIRMADLYAAEGSYAEARDIYEDLLARDPSNASIRSKLEALPPPLAAAPEPPPDIEPEVSAAAAEPVSEAASSRNPKVDKLQGWLAKVKRV